MRPPEPLAIDSEPLRLFVYKILRSRQITHEEAEDLTQEVMLKAWRGFPRFQHRCHIRVWLSHIAHNEWVRMIRERSRLITTLSLEQILEDLPGDGNDGAWSRDPAATPEQLVLWRCIGEHIESALGTLPDRQRDAIEAICVDQDSYEDAIRKLGVPAGTIKSRVSRGKEHLRRVLTQYAPGE